MPTKTNISGFPEYLPSEQLAFNSIVSKVTQVYQSFGFVPLETAAVERIDTLTSKGIDSKEVYALRRLNAVGDEGDKDIALRFDLTVPLARYVSQNYGQLTFPYRRYQVQPVWRGERPQLGRYRQFHQFDIDTIGDTTLPIAADAEILAAAYQALTAILPTGTKFTMRVNNRKLLMGLIQAGGYTTEEQTYQALKVIDDLEKVSKAEAIEKLKAINPKADAEVFIARMTNKNLDIINDSHPLIQEGANELRAVLTLTQQMLGGKGNVQADLTIARGLDYYTGTVVETKLHDAPDFGSICSGGRYDNLTESLSDRKLPGVGISIGLSRLAVWLMDQEPYKSMPASTASAIVAGPEAATAAAALRAAGLNVELALGDKSPGQHFQNAAKRGLQYGILAENGTLTLRPFATRQDETNLTPAQIAEKLA